MASKQQNHGDTLGSPAAASCDTADFEMAFVGAHINTFGMDDLFCNSSRSYLPENSSENGTFSLEDAPVYRDLMPIRCVTEPIITDAFTPVAKPTRMLSCYSEPPRANKASPPPVPPLFVLEKSHLVLKDVPLTRALDHVVACLDKYSVIDSSVYCDCNVVRKEFKIRGMLHSRFDSADFRVRVFQSRTDGHMAIPLVEFQRRSGDLFLFRRFFNKMTVELVGNGSPTRRFGQVPDIVMDLGDDKPDLEDEIEPLCQMLQSEYMDMQLEGLRALGQVIGETTDKKLISALPTLTKPVLKLVASADSELRCAAVSLVATTCTRLKQQNTKAAQALMAEFAVPIVLTLKNVRYSYTTAHTRRECARVLSAVTNMKSCAKYIIQAGGIEALRQCMWQDSDDIKSFADTALRNLVVASR